MHVHKFITKYKASNIRTQPISIFWIPKKVTHKPARLNGGMKWEIFAQGIITIQARPTTTLILEFGFLMTRGISFDSLGEELKRKRLSLQDGTIAEDVVEDIIISIRNNSEAVVVIKDGDSLCYIKYHI